MTLGELIDALKRRPADDTVRFDFCGYVPGELMSYRGFYDHLAIEPTSVGRPSVGEFLTRLRGAVGSKHTGYKGGTFVMRIDTPIWCAGYGQASSTAIVGIYDCSYMTVIRTEWVAV
jgi:hypothetical protein